MCNLLQDFFNYPYERGIDISLYISKLEKVAFRLKALNEHSNEMLISKILSILLDSYQHEKKTNHRINSCYFRVRRKKQWKKGSIFNWKTGKLYEKKNMFVIDSGSTSYIVNDIELFETIEESKETDRNKKSRTGKNRN